jgi:hypothetical protein
MEAARATAKEKGVRLVSLEEIEHMLIEAAS